MKINEHTGINLDKFSIKILNALNAHVAVSDADGIIVAFNNQWKKSQETISEKWVRPDLGDNFLKSLQEPILEKNDYALRLFLGVKSVLSGEKNQFTLNYPVNIYDEKSWYKITINTLENGEGAVLINEDISSQIHSRQYIRETQQKFEQFFENSLYGILVTDENNRIIETNRTAARLLESPLDLLLSRDVSKFLNFEVGSPKEIQKLINKEENHLGEKEVVTVSGRKVPVEIHVGLLRNDSGASITSWAFKDISDKKRSEEALKISDKRYRQQFENSQEGIILARPDGIMLEANPAACRFLGYKPEELAHTHRDIIFDSSLPKNAEALNQKAKHNYFSGELEFMHKSGRLIPVELNSSIYQQDNGEPRSIINFKDISEQKIIEKQLLAEKKFTESAILSLPNAFFVFNEDGKLIRWNDRLLQDFEYTAEEISNLNVFDLVHPEDRKLAKDYLIVDHSGEPVNAEFRCITKTGTVLHYHITGKGFKENGVHFTVGGGVNLNDLKKVELEKERNSEMLRQLFSRSSVGIVLINNDGTIQNSNTSFEQIFGYTSSELKGKVLDDVIVPKNLGKHAKTLSRFSFMDESFQTESTRVRKDGKEIPVLIGGVPVEIDGEIIAIYGMYVDITERRQLEHQITELLEKEKKARHHMEDMFEEAPSAIAMLEGEDQVFTFANDEFKKLVGVDKLLEESFVELFPELSDQGFLSLLNECFHSGETLHFKEKSIKFNNCDHTKYLDFIYKPLFDDEQKVYGIFIQAVNVTEQVVARNIIEKSLAEKETLLIEVHHRVKNNLAIISGLLELEMMDNSDVSVAKHLSSTQSRITTIARIHEMLYQNETLSHVSFSQYLEKMLTDNKLKHKNDIPVISQFKLDDLQLNVNQAIPVGMLLNEILSLLAELCPDKNQQHSGMKLVLTDKADKVDIRLFDYSNSVLQQFDENRKNATGLNYELINVLLKQTHG
ncbi:MAG: PAS domain S-box protein, partial [Balneolaceae bacterium]